jgi:hypothetical protein
MSANRFRSRLLKLEQRILPADDGTCTLEEACRVMWRRDKQHFLELSENTNLIHFARQFEFEDLEREQRS